MSITIYYGDQVGEFALDPVGCSCIGSGSNTPVDNASLAVDNCIFGFVATATDEEV